MIEHRTIQLKDGEYKGQIKIMRDGFGSMSFKNGDYFEGIWSQNEMKHGIYYFKTKGKYEGSFKNGKMDGFGTYIFNNGNRYEGEFKNGLFDGWGKLMESQYIYEGYFYNGERSGDFDIKDKNGKLITKTFFL